MNEKIITENKKMNKRQFLRRLATDNNMTVAAATDAYEAVVGTIQNIVSEGKVLSLTKFGNFFIQKHKGHPVKFDDTTEAVEDYVVFKFSASDALNKEFRQKYKSGELSV